MPRGKKKNQSKGRQRTNRSNKGMGRETERSKMEQY